MHGANRQTDKQTHIQTNATDQPASNKQDKRRKINRDKTNN